MRSLMLILMSAIVLSASPGQAQAQGAATSANGAFAKAQCYECRYNADYHQWECAAVPSPTGSSYRSCLPDYSGCALSGPCSPFKTLKVANVLPDGSLSAKIARVRTTSIRGAVFERGCEDKVIARHYSAVAGRTIRVQTASLRV